MSEVEEGYTNPQLLASAEWLLEHLGEPDFVVADVRSPLQYMTRHIPNAIFIPYEEILDIRPGSPSLDVAPKEGVERAFGEYGIDNDKTVVVYGDLGGTAAARLFWTLEYYGHPRAKLLNLDFSQWVRMGLKATGERPNISKTQFTAKPEASRIADASYILANLKRPEIALVDSRSPQEYFGQVATGARPGRIPGSINLPHAMCVGMGRPFRPSSELSRAFQERGVTKDREVITYCMVGERSAHTYVALRLLGYPKARLYVKSFSEWGNDPALPVEF